MNDVKLIGRLADNPELTYTVSGTQVTNFDLAVQKKTKDRDAPPNFIPITCWGRNAEFAAKYLSKGRRIAVSGHLDTNRWRDKHDQTRKDVYVVSDNIEFLDSIKDDKNDGREEG